MAFKTIIEPFRIKTVEPIKMSSVAERKNYIKNAHYNPFLLKSSQVIIDMLTDSGTSAMSQNQWAAMMQGDESYAGAASWERFYDAVNDLTGFEFVLPTHQGRAAERILYGYLGGKGKIFISNTHFDTTRANIEFSGATAIDIPVKEGKDFDSDYPFKGNLDITLLQQLIKKHGKNIAAVIVTVTNNSGGGQPVSMENMKAVSALCKKNKLLCILDCCRVAENAYFIKHREKAYANHSYRQIAQQMFALADGAIMSAKKDALVNMGGFFSCGR
jgi:tyrosine phenol-lyase